MNTIFHFIQKKISHTTSWKSLLLYTMIGRDKILLCDCVTTLRGVLEKKTCLQALGEMI